MTTELAQGRARRAGWIAGLAAALAGVAIVTVAIQARGRDADAVAGPVLPGFAERVRDAARITVATAEARYEIQRTQKGWALKDRGNFPVRREVLAQFTDGLRSLAYVRPMTRDPDRHDRLGLGDPAQGGSGVLVQVEDSQGARLADLIIGQEAGGALFLRKPGEDQTWQVRGEMPPLRDVARWLDLAPLALDAARIAGAEVQPPTGPAYAVARANESASFALAAPYDALPVLSPGDVADAALMLSQLTPVDVRPAAAVPGPPRARSRLRTFDGLLIEAEMFEEPGGRYWIKLIARAEQPAMEAEAAGVNARVGPWAYGVSEAQFQDAAPPLSVLAGRPESAPQKQ
ncbi:MAG: DUF4340 domain-containing protein [Hyphomonadaceae bacterium]|nr:DUF4340 domain-containing protein [Hyphomonadaceae bacterium]